MRQAGSERSKNFSEQLRTALMAGRYPQGRRLPPIRPLSEEYDLTPMVVRLAIQRLAEEGLLESRHGSGVYVRALPSKPVVAIVTAHDPEALGSLYFITSCALRLQERAREEGWETRIYLRRSTGGNRISTPDPEILRDINCDVLRGCFAFHARDTEPWARRAEEKGVPVVAASVNEFSLRVGTDYSSMIRAAVDLIAKTGRRRVGLVRWHDAEFGGDMFVPQFAAALASQGMEFNPAWTPDNLRHPIISGEGARMFREIWRASPRPDAVLFADDVLFHDASFQMIREAIRIPDDLLVVTHFNKGSGIPVPFPATLLQFDPADTANAMADIMRAVLRGETPTGRDIREITFHVCESDGFQDGRRAGGTTPNQHVETTTATGRGAR